MKYDIVITWVDGDDPVWRRKREAHSTEFCSQLNVATANVEGRFRDNGELIYLLRSIRQFCGSDLGDVILVVDKQRPAYIDEFPWVRVVDHCDFIPREYLPTFSSRAIEASLHRIHGLREHFVYFNDDIALMRQVTFGDFFAGGAGVFYFTDEKLPEGRYGEILSGQNDALNAQAFMLENYGMSAVERIGEHSPRGIHKSIMLEIERCHPDLFHEVRAEKFRKLSGQSILANLYPEWCLANGLGEIRVNHCAYVLTDDIERSPEGFARSLVEEIAGKKLSLCVNDTGDDRDIHLAQEAYVTAMDRLFA